MTKEDAQGYAEAFLETYAAELENKFRPEDREYFDFYAKFPYNIEATVSNTRGAAIEFIPSDESSIDFRSVEQRIDLAVFPDIDLGIISDSPYVNATVLIYNGEPSGAMFHITGKGIMFKNIILITNKGHLLDLGNEGDITLSNVVVDGRYYHLMLIKGSSTASSWTQDIAQEDAMRSFEEDVLGAFARSEEIRKYTAYPILEELISQVVWKHQHAEEIGYDLLQYYKDLSRIRELAVNTYHLNSTFVDEILDWLEGIYPKQPWWELAPYSWILGGVVGSAITCVLKFAYDIGERALSRRRRAESSGQQKQSEQRSADPSH